MSKLKSQNYIANLKSQQRLPALRHFAEVSPPVGIRDP